MSGFKFIGKLDRSGGQVTSLIIASALIVLITAFVYWEVKEFGFVDWDDRHYVYENPRINGFTAENIKWAWTTNHHNNYHPLTWLSHMLDVELFGVRPAAHHLINIILHTANSLLLLALLRNMTGALGRSAFVAAVFAVHPLHVESVAWIAERKDVLSIFFGLVALLAYTQYTRRVEPKRRWYLLALAAFACSLLSKQTLVTLPFLMLVLDWWPLGRTRQTSPRKVAVWMRLVTEKLPFFALAISFSTIIYLLQKPMDFSDYTTPSVPVRVFNLVLTYGLYLKKAVWPNDLVVFYQHPGEAISYAAVAISAIVLGTVTILAAAWRRRRPYMLAGWLWFLGTLAPMSAQEVIFSSSAQQMADRYMYFPLIGLSILAAWLAVDAAPAGFWRTRLLPAAGGAAVIVLMGLARQQTAYWENTETLFQRVVNVTENNSVGHAKLGYEYLEKGQFDKAVRHFQEAIRISPQVATNYANLATALRGQHRIPEALAYLEAALRIKPSDPGLYNNLGSMLHESGQSEEAIQQLRHSIKIDSNYGPSHKILGNIFYDLGQFEEALSHFHHAIRLLPDDPSLRRRVAAAHLNVGAQIATTGRINKAIPHFRTAVRFDPDLLQAHLNLAMAWLQTKKLNEAELQYRGILERWPQAAEAYNGLGEVLLAKGRQDLAAPYFRQAQFLKRRSQNAPQNLKREFGNQN